MFRRIPIANLPKPAFACKIFCQPGASWQKWIESLIPSPSTPAQAAGGVPAGSANGADVGGVDFACGLVTNASSLAAFSGPTVDRVGPRSGELHCIAQRVQ